MTSEMSAIKKSSLQSDNVQEEFEKLARDIFLKASIGIYIVQDGYFKYVNPLFLELTGHSEEDLISKYSLNFVHPDDRKFVRQTAIDNLKGKSLSSYEYRYMKKNGEYIWVLEKVASIKYKGKRATIGQFMDITDRKKVEIALRESEEKSRELIENSPSGIAIMTSKGKIVDVNPALVSLYGYDSKEEFLSIPVDELYWDRKDRPKFIKQLKSGGVKDFEIRGKIKNGSMFWYSVSSITRPTSDGSTQFICFSKNISDHKRAEIRISIHSGLDDVLSAKVEVPDLLEKLVEALVSKSGVACGGSYLVDQESGAVDLTFHKGLPDGFIEHASHFKAHSIFARFIHNAPLICHIDDGLGRTFKNLIRREGFSSIIIAPIKYEGSTFAYIFLASYAHMDTVYISDVVDSVVARAGQAIMRIRSEEALQESEERFRDIIEGARESIIAIDSDGHIILANDFACETTGYSKEEFLSMKVQDIDPKGFEKDFVSKLWDKMSEGEKRTFEAIHRRKDGSLFPVEVNVTKIMLGGRPAVLDFSTDITRRKLYENRAKIRQDLATALAAEITLDEALMICVESAISLTGMIGGGIYLVDQETGNLTLTFQRRLPDNFVKQASFFESSSSFASLVKKGEPFYYIDNKVDSIISELIEHTGMVTHAFASIVHGDNVIGCLLIYSNMSIIFDDNTLEVFTDVGARAASVIARIRSEQALKYREELEHLISSISTEFTNLDSYEIDQGINRTLKMVGEFCGADRSHILLFSSDFMTMSIVYEWCSDGVEPQIHSVQEVSLDDFDYIKGIIESHDILNISRLAELPSKYSTAKSVLKAAGIQSVISVPMVSKKDTVGLISLNQIRTEKIWSNEVAVLLTVIGENIANALERKWADDERAAILEDLRITNNKLGESNQELVDFAYIASHDLREPLRKIASFGGLLQESLEGKLDDDEKENFQFMIDGANRMQIMIEDLLSYSRITTKAKPFERVDLNKVVDDLKSLELAMLIEDKKGSVNIPEPLPFVYGDPSQMRQLLQNLIGNGLKFHREGVPPKITVRSGRIRNGMVRVEVQDNGIGIPKEYYDQIFTMFKRLHSRDKYEGTGIGLAVCKKIVTRHGGEIGIKSNAENGTTFWFIIPTVTDLESKKKE